MRSLLTRVLFVASALLFSANSAAHAWLKLELATSEYPPYTSTEMEYNGYINHIINQAFLETGVVIEYSSLQWDDAIEAARKGDYDAVSYGNYVRAREDEFWHSKPITAENLILYVRKDGQLKEWQTLEDLKQYKMGVTKGYLYTDEIAEYIEQGKNVQVFESDEANFNALLEGKIDVFPVDELTGWYLLQREFSDQQRRQLMPLDTYLATVTTHLLVPKGRKNSRLILELFNRGLEQMTLEGKMQRFKRLLKEGFYQHPKKPVNYDRR